MPRTLFEAARVDRKVLTITTFEEAEQQDNAEFRNMSPQKRLEVVELLRQMNHDYDPDTARLPRVYSIIKRTKR